MKDLAAVDARLIMSCLDMLVLEVPVRVDEGRNVTWKVTETEWECEENCVLEEHTFMEMGNYIYMMYMQNVWAILAHLRLSWPFRLVDRHTCFCKTT